jgi:hypothetical protein
VRLVQDGWHDETECLVFFRIRTATGQTVWESTWYEIREFFESKETIVDLRKSVAEACEKYGLVVDLSSDDYSQWGDDG